MFIQQELERLSISQQLESASTSDIESEGESKRSMFVASVVSQQTSVLFGPKSPA